MAFSHLDIPHLDVAIGEYTHRLRDLLESLSIARKQLRELAACQEVMRGALTQVSLVLAQLPPTAGTERALNRLDWFLHSTEEAEKALEDLLEGHRDALPRLIAQERIATQILGGLNAVVEGGGEAPARSKSEGGPRLALVGG